MMIAGNRDRDKMGDYYTITDKDSIVIYGGGAFGKERYQYFSRYYHISAFFDRNADSISLEGSNVPVYSPQDGVKKLGINIVVVICIHNAFVHQEVAQDLYALGINKIIFIPMGDNYLTASRMQMLEVYTYCCEHDMDKIIKIPYYSTLLRADSIDCIIRSNNEFVVCWCPIDLLYTDKCWEEGNGDIPVASFQALSEGYEFFQGQSKNADNFIQVYMSGDGQSEGVGDFLQRRFNTYLMLEKEWKENHEYFKYAPAEVKWNERAYFNVQDGHNRICFLINKGCKWVPVRMSREDYQLWVNYPVYQTIKERTGESGRQFAYHLPHPCFRYEKILRDDFCVDILCETLKYLGKENREIKKVLEISEYNGYFADNYLRMGAKYAAVLENKEETIGSISIIQELIQVRNIQVIKDICCIEGDVELAVILKDICEKSLEKILKIDSMINCRFLIYKTYRNAEKTRRILNDCGYGQYHFLLRIIEEEEVREIGIYRRLF